jgi:hypothetical protein
VIIIDDAETLLAAEHRQRGIFLKVLTRAFDGFSDVALRIFLVTTSPLSSALRSALDEVGAVLGPPEVSRD